MRTPQFCRSVRIWKGSQLHVLLILPLLILLTIGCWGVEPSYADEVKFQWAFSARVAHDGPERLIRIEKDTTLHTGDQMKMFIKPQSNCYIYLIYLSSAAELMLLYPTDLSASRTTTGIAHFIPNGSAWFALDEQTGKEKFYLLASVRRLTELENLLSKYAQKDTGVIAQTSAVQDVLAEIKAVKRRYRNFNSTAERPIRIGGNFRGTEKQPSQTGLDEVTRMAVEITASEFYSRTFTIDHR